MRAQMHDIVVLLPGISGSVLRKDGRTVWGLSSRSLGTTLFTRGRWLREQLLLQDDHPGPELLDDGIEAVATIPDIHLIPGIWKIDGYGKVARVLHDRFRLQAGKNFFQFPYDWRRDNRSAARQLARQSHDWLKRRREDGFKDAKLILIGHSMGGIVSRYFLEVLGGWRDTRALITFGTPYRGSLNALDGLSNGLRKGPFGLLDLSELMRSFTSMYQLLPIYPCVYDAGDELVRVTESAAIPNLDPARAQAARAFHTEIWEAVEQNRKDPNWEEHGYELFPVVGIEQVTNQSARPNDEGVALYTTYKGQDLSGDGTVPRVSAIPRELQGRDVDMYAATKHGSLQNASAVLTHVGGRVEDLFLQLGRFRSFGVPAKDVRVALEVDDLLMSNEPIPVRARPSDESAALTASLIDSESDQVLQQVDLKTGDDGWQGGIFEPVAEGSYRVTVSGPSLAVVPEDAIAIADAEAVASDGD